MFGWPNCYISNDHLDRSILAEAGSQILLFGHSVSFLGTKYSCTDSLHLEHGQLSQKLWPWSSLNHSQAASRGWWDQVFLGCQGKVSHLALTAVVLPSCNLRLTQSSLLSGSMNKFELKTLRHQKCRPQDHAPSKNSQAKEFLKLQT